MQWSQRALVVIDMVQWDADPSSTFAAQLADGGLDASYYWDRVEAQVVPNVRAMLDHFRSNSGRVVFTEASTFFSDYADCSANLIDMFSKAGACQPEAAARTRGDLPPLPGEAVLIKPSSDAFASTQIDYIFKAAGVKEVAIAGVITNACVLLTALSAWDHGYQVTVVDDACATYNDELHEAALTVLRFLKVQVVSTRDYIEQGFAGQPSGDGSLSANDVASFVTSS